MRFAVRVASGLVGLALAATTIATVRAQNATPVGNGSTARPGPSVLYQAPPRAPQLENTGVWSARPTLVCFSSAYRHSEYVYQGCPWDDQGGGPYYTWFFNAFQKDYAYPTNPIYRGNAANIIEVRLKPLADATAIRVTFNTMLDPNLVATTIALGDSSQPVQVPHGANTVMPAEIFVTAHGNRGDIVDGATGWALPAQPSVSTDLTRRQVEIRVPYAAFDPRGRTSVRVGAAAGLWDEANGAYLVPRPGNPTFTQPGAGTDLNPNPSAFFDVAFRFNEPVDAPWRNRQQLAAIASGDIGQFSTDVDFAKLARKVNDDSGIPKTGYINRIYASHFESRQGRRVPTDPGGPPPGAVTQQNGLSSTAPGDSRRPSFQGGWPCHDSCVPDLPGQLQRYLVYVPSLPAPADGYGRFVWLPGYALTPADNVQGAGDIYQAVANRPGNPTLAIGVDGRGADGWYYGQAGASIFEALADVARHYRVSSTKIAIAGFSSGAYGANKLSLQFPDLFGRAFICDGLEEAPSFPYLNSVFDVLPVDTGTVHEPGSQMIPLLPSRLDQPVMEWAGYNDDWIPYDITFRRLPAYAAGRDDFEFISWAGEAGEHLNQCNNNTFDRIMTPWLGDMEPIANPATVTYVRNPKMDDPVSGLVGDHAYWLSGIETWADSTKQFLGTVTVFSHGFGQPPRPAVQPTTEAGSLIARGDISGNPQLSLDTVDVYTREYRHFGPPPTGPAADVLDIHATNIRTVTIDPVRAHVDCNATLNVEADGPLSVTLSGCFTRQYS